MLRYVESSCPWFVYGLLLICWVDVGDNLVEMVRVKTECRSHGFNAVYDGKQTDLMVHTGSVSEVSVQSQNSETLYSSRASVTTVTIGSGVIRTQPQPIVTNELPTVFNHASVIAVTEH